jgi:polyferredoxin
MLSLFLNKWIISLIISIVIVIIIYYIKDSKGTLKTKKEKKSRNKYYIKLFIILYLASVILFYIYEYAFENSNFRLSKLFKGGYLNNMSKSLGVVQNTEINNIKIIDNDIDTDISEW